MRLTLTILLLFTTLTSQSQCFDTIQNKFKYNQNLIDNGNTTICFGSSISISAKGLGSQVCTNLNLVNGIATVKPNKTTTYYVYSIKESGNLIPNGDFKFGDTLFSSDYTKFLFNIWRQGNYVLGTSPQLLHPKFSDCHDHTDGKGNMLLANGNSNHERVWYVSIPVQTNQTYDFSYWAQGVIGLLPSEDISKLQVYINGQPVGNVFEVERNPCTWQQFKVQWNSGSSTTANISIVDMNLADASNDFALDDISLSTTYYEKDSVVIEVTPAPKTVYDTIRTCNSNVPGTYIDTLREGNCDTLYKVHTVEVTTTLPITKVCEYYGCSSYTFNGVIYHKDATIKDTLKSWQGCDSLYRINKIIIGKIIPIIKADTLRDCGFIRYNGEQYLEPATIYLDTIRTREGCDSLIHVKQIQPSTPAQLRTEVIVSCTPKIYRGKLYNTSTVVYDTIKSVINPLCDSIRIIGEVYINPPLRRDTVNIPSCNNFKPVIDTFKSQLGCDSLIRLTRYIVDKQTKTDTINATLCSGESFTMPSGAVVNNSGTHRDTIRYSGGCDSLITIANIKIKPLYKSVSKSSICLPDGYITTSTGQVINKPGVYDDTIRYVTGCDSLIKHIEVTQTQARVDNATVTVDCKSSYTLPTGQIVTKDEDFTSVIPSRGGCDSVIKILHIRFKKGQRGLARKSNDVNCQLGYATLTATGGVKYNWQGQGNTSTVTVTPDKTTTYKVDVTTNAGCTYTDSVTVKVSKTDAGDIEVPTAFTPNGDGLNDCYSVKNLGSVQDFNLKIFNRWGVLMFETSDNKKCWDGTYKGVAQNMDTYVYQLTGKSACGELFKKGTIVLIR